MIFNADDFELSMEMQLKLRVMKDEIENSSDVQALQKNLISTSELLLRYQKIINVLMNNEMERQVAKLLAEGPSESTKM